jgi:hypothetical protein
MFESLEQQASPSSKAGEKHPGRHENGLGFLDQIKNQGSPLRKDRVIGASEEEEAVILRSYHEQVVDPARSATFRNEREKTSEELLMLDRARRNVNSLRGKYGFTPIAINAEHLRTIAAREVEVGPKIVRKAGTYDSFFEVGFVTDSMESKRYGIGRFQAMQHELIHRGQHQSLRLKRGANVDGYKIGIQITSQHPNEQGEYLPYLLPLNEAIVEENNRRLIVSLPVSDPEIGYIARSREEDLEELRQFRRGNPEHKDSDMLLDDEEIVQSSINPITNQPQIEKFGYYDERQAMWKLFDKIHEKNPEAFPGKSSEEAREAMFDMVTKASFDGDVRPFGRLMNETFGLGTFRKYGHLQTVQEIVAYLDALDKVNGVQAEQAAQGQAGANPESGKTEDKKDEGEVKDAEVEDDRK